MKTTTIHSWLLALLMAALLPGCSATKASRAGDASVRVTERFTGFDLFPSAKHVYEIELPRVSLSETGEHRFQIRGMTEPVTPNELFLVYGVFQSKSERLYRKEWGNAKLSIRIADTNGLQLFAHTVVFATAEFGSDYARYGRPNFSYNLDYRPQESLSGRIRGLTDYDLYLSVDTPTKEPGHFVQLRGKSYSFPTRPRIDTENRDQQPKSL